MDAETSNAELPKLCTPPSSVCPLGLGNPLATGQDGRILKIDWDGNVLGAIGNGPGRGEGQRK